MSTKDEGDFKDVWSILHFMDPCVESGHDEVNKYKSSRESLNVGKGMHRHRLLFVVPGW